MAFATTRATTAPTDDVIAYQARKRCIDEMLLDRFLRFTRPSSGGDPDLCVARCSSRRGSDGHAALLGAADQLDLVGAVDRREGGEQVVTIGDGLAGGLDDEVARLDPGRLGRAALLDATDQDAVTLRQADGSAQPPGDMRRGDRDAEPGPRGRLAEGQRIDALAQGRVGREGEIEPLADPVGVEADEPARRVDEGPTGRARGERGVCSTLPSMRRPPGPRNARAFADTSPKVTRLPPPCEAAAPKTGVPIASSAPSPTRPQQPRRYRP